MKKRAYSRPLDEALALAATAHREQRRKGSEIPYIQHPVHVGILLMKHGFGEDVIIAGLLHDVVEDTGVDIEDIAARFGAEVARLVAGVTEQKKEGGADRPWRARKEDMIKHLRRADTAGAALKAADALHNCQTTLADIRAQGAAAWRRFNAPPEDQVWYYGTIAELCRERLGEHPLCDELDAAVDALRRWEELVAQA